MAKEVVTDRDVQDVLTLSRLEVEQEEIKGLKKDLNDIISYFGVLEEVNTDGVPETIKIEGEPRPDEVVSSMKVEDVVKNAPHHSHNAFIVPRVVE